MKGFTAPLASGCRRNVKGVSSHLPAFQCELPDLVAEGGRRKGLASQLCHVYAGIVAGSFIPHVSLPVQW